MYRQFLSAEPKRTHGQMAMPYTSIFDAARDGRVDDIRYAVAHGADPNAIDERGCTPVYLAAKNGHVECVRFLVSAGANVNKTTARGLTPVYIAALKGHVECVRTCLLYTSPSPRD